MRWRETLFAAVIASPLGTAANQGRQHASDPSYPSATIDILVTNVRNSQGVVRASLCRQSEFLGNDCGYKASAPARAGAVQMTLTDIMPGTYAIQAWHDETNTDQVHRGILGIPREGVGFSNDPRLLVGPPSFHNSALPIIPGTNATRLRLRYFN